ncbi:uncharacterized protein LOC132560650 [Ylistrum balloti]|uniref:uncharacterized protein LOC132560650 n=1 Tax=Ylistrum balloti TaxID=509963 RepID=UPI002905CCB2|nr:uncharacterized protein LOC132560650 [Ylistrum balloti]
MWTTREVIDANMPDVFKEKFPNTRVIIGCTEIQTETNQPSPAVATFGLRKVVEDASDDIKEFVQRNFYVDDGLTCDDVDSAISLVKRTQHTLKDNGNIRLHKIASNNPKVLDAFSAEDIAKDISDKGIQEDTTPLQRSLGRQWDIANDSFTFQIDIGYKPYTRHGVLATT